METTQKPRTTPKDFFLYFWVTVSLYISAVSLIALLFAVIDQQFPGVLAYVDPYSTGVRTAIATLIVIFPVYILVSRYVYGMERAMPEKRELGVRKWLTYFNLFVGGLVLIIDLIVLLNRFLGGTDFTTGFFLKVIAVFVIVGALFSYYIYDLKHSPAEAGNVARNTGGVAIVFVILSLVVGFVVMGSPATQRMMHYDDQRVSDIQNINYQIINYWQLKRALPVMLTDVENKATGYALPIDPETKVAYSYEVVKPLSYKLCATFSLANDVVPGTMRNAEAQPVPAPVSAVKMTGQENWSHGVGAQCFTRTIDPDLYPPFNTPVKVVPASNKLF